MCVCVCGEAAALIMNKQEVVRVRRRYILLLVVTFIHYISIYTHAHTTTSSYIYDVHNARYLIQTSLDKNVHQLWRTNKDFGVYNNVVQFVLRTLPKLSVCPLNWAIKIE